MSSTKKRTAAKVRKLPFDKYDLYRKAVQSAETDVEFIRDSYKELKKKKPRRLREDFCGTFALSCEWLKLDPENEACAIDLDPEPMMYGAKHYLSELTMHQQSRIWLLEGDVTKIKLPKVDIALAMNFSYFCFKNRPLMVHYFRNVYESLQKDGVFILDLFGGKQCADAIEDTIKHPGFTYYWDQESFDPVTNEAMFHIHFRYKGKKVKNVFNYDWRMWSIPELKDILQEVGFKKSHVYWEGTAKDGSGNGKFTRTEVGESCDSWIAYIAAEK